MTHPEVRATSEERESGWKPDRAEAQFLGELLALDAALAEIARGMLSKGHSLSYVVETFKAAQRVAAAVRGAA